MTKEGAAASPSRRWREWLATPAQWLAAALIVQAAAWGPALMSRDDRALSNPYAFQDTYYVVVRTRYVLSLAAGMVVFAALYLLLDAFVRVARRRGLRLAHLGLTLGGAVLILSPTIVFGLVGMPRRYVDVEPAFALWNRVSTVGYAMTLIGLLVFVVVVIDAIVRRWFLSTPADPTLSTPP